VPKEENSKQPSHSPDSGVSRNEKLLQPHRDKISKCISQIDTALQELKEVIKTLPSSRILNNAKEFLKLRSDILYNPDPIDLNEARQSLSPLLEDLEKLNNNPPEEIEEIKSEINEIKNNLNGLELEEIASKCTYLFNMPGFICTEWAHQQLGNIFGGLNKIFQLFLEFQDLALHILELTPKIQCIDEEEKKRLNDFLRSNNLRELNKKEFKKIQAIEKAFSLEQFVKKGSYTPKLGPLIYYSIFKLERKFLSDLEEKKSTFKFLTYDDSISYAIFNRAYHLFPNDHFYELGQAIFEYEQDDINDLGLLYRAIFESWPIEDRHNLVPFIRSLAKRLKGINIRASADKNSFLQETIHHNDSERISDPELLNNLELICWSDDLLEKRLTELHKFSNEILNLPDVRSDEPEDSDSPQESQPAYEREIIRHTLLPGVLELLLRYKSDEIQYCDISGINLLDLAKAVLGKGKSKRPDDARLWGFNPITYTGLNKIMRGISKHLNKLHKLRENDGQEYIDRPEDYLHENFRLTMHAHLKGISVYIQYYEWYSSSLIAGKSDLEIIDLFLETLIKKSEIKKNDPQENANVLALQKLHERIKQDMSVIDPRNIFLDVDRNCLPFNTETILNNLVFWDENELKIDTDLLYLIDQEHDGYKKLAHYLLINIGNSLDPQSFNEIKAPCKALDKQRLTSKYPNVAGFGMGATKKTIQEIKTLLDEGKDLKDLNDAKIQAQYKEIEEQHKRDNIFIPKKIRISFETLCKHMKDMRDQAEALKTKYQNPDFLNTLNTENTLQNSKIVSTPNNRRKNGFWERFFCEHNLADDSHDETRTFLSSNQNLVQKPVMAQPK
jgi:hypothetical protein